MDAFNKALQERIHAMTKGSKKSPEEPAQGKETPSRAEYMKRTDAIIEDIKAHLPKWDKQTMGTGIWIFDHEGAKAKYLVEELAHEQSVSPKVVIQALQHTVATKGYGILIVAVSIMPNVDQEGEEGELSVEEAHRLMQRISEDPEALGGLAQGIMLYRETQDGFLDLKLYRVRDDTKALEAYMPGMFKREGIATIAKNLGLKTFDIAKGDQKSA